MNDATTANATGTGVIMAGDPLLDAAASQPGTSLDTAPELSTSAKVGLTIAGGLALGLVAGALWPRGKPRKIAKKSREIADMVGELSQLLAAQTIERAATAAGDSRDKLESLSRGIGKSIQERSAGVREQAHRLTDEATGQFHHGSKALARIVVKLVEKTRR